MGGPWADDDRRAAADAMLRFVARRLAMLALTLLVASFAIYASLSIAPGNPLSVLTGGRTLPPEALAVLRARYHLDQPLPAQYWHWLTSAAARRPRRLDRAARERQHADPRARRA